MDGEDRFNVSWYTDKDTITFKVSAASAHSLTLGILSNPCLKLPDLPRGYVTATCSTPLS